MSLLSGSEGLRWQLFKIDSNQIRKSYLGSKIQAASLLR
jgi:hypothetical protein